MNEEKSLPRGWTWAKLRDVVAPSESRNPSNEEDGEFFYIDIEALDNKKLLITSPKKLLKSGAPSRARMRVRRGDVIFSLVRPYLRNISIVPEELDNQIASTAYCVLKPLAVESKYLFYFVSQNSFINSIPTYGTSPPSARDVEFLTLQIPVAPLEEQKRIVLKLETMFSELDAGLSAIARARAKVKGFRASLLRSATSGELSAQWRAENPSSESGAALLKRILDERRAAWEARERAKRSAKSPSKKLFEDESWKANYVEPKAPDTANLPQLPESWCWASVAQLAALSQNSLSIGPFGSNLKVSDYKTEGVPLVFVRNIRAESFGLAKAKYVSEEKAAELSSHSVESGEILITKMGEPPGDACLYPLDHPKAIITADCIKWKTVAELNASFFVHSINSTILKRQIEGMTKGVAQQKISLDRFRGIATPLPPLDEQEWIVGEVERRLSLVSEAEKTLDAAHKRAQSLKAAILARAFRGELCEQNPVDESAEALLERIREAREAASKRTKRGKSGQGSLF